MVALVVVTSTGLPPRSGVFLVPGQTPIAPDVGALAPPIMAFDLLNRRFSLWELRGSPVILNFWATWCAPCVIEMPRLQAAHERFRGQDLRVVGINVNDPPADVLTWTRQAGIRYDLLIDHDGRLSYLYQVRTLPLTVFIGRDGLVREVVRGEVSQAALDAAITRLLTPGP
jgi:thiol-disulfide isomerase/thioredoxin